MRVRLYLSWAIFALALALLVAGIWPKLQGGHFNRDALLGAMFLFVSASAALRRNRRRAAGGE